jgi:hypothetical protein
VAWIRTSYGFGSDVKIEWVLASMNDGNSAVVAVYVITPSGVVRLE